MPQKPRRRKESSPAEPKAPPAAATSRVRVVVTETAPIDDGGLSLEELGQTFAEMLEHGDDPYQAAPETEAMGDQPRAVARPETIDDAGTPASAASAGACEVSPRTILEAMLFVGHPHNEPLSGQRVASLMRGVTAEEIDELVRDLNEEYSSDGAPYEIVSAGAGYQLVLRSEFAGIHENFSGKVREAKLSQAAIDVLAVVAYQQPVTRSDVEKRRGQPSGAVLSQLVRRDLLRIERPDQKPREPKYFTTDRFLTFFGLESLDDLPRSQELERDL